MTLSRRSLLTAGAAALATPARATAPLRLGMLKTLSPAPFYIAQQRGMFAAQGVAVEFKFFEAAQPIAAAAVAGDIDVGVTALTGGFFALAGKGELKVIGGGMHEQKGYELTAVLVSKAAYDAGLTSLDKLGGHSFGITQYGSSFHYMIGRLAAARGFDLKSVTLRPLQQISNMVAAVRTGQVDATMAIASMARPVEAAGEGHIIGWVGDDVPYQITALFAPSATLTGRTQDLRHFCAAYRQGVAAYRAAFLTMVNGKPAYSPETDKAIADITRYVFTGDPKAAEKIKDGVGWYDPDAALDVADVKAQIAWFEAQGLVKGHVDPAEVIDTSFMPVR